MRKFRWKWVFFSFLLAGVTAMNIEMSIWNGKFVHAFIRFIFAVDFFILSWRARNFRVQHLRHIIISLSWCHHSALTPSPFSLSTSIITCLMKSSTKSLNVIAFRKFFQFSFLLNYSSPSLLLSSSYPLNSTGNLLLSISIFIVEHHNELQWSELRFVHWRLSKFLW